jgi:hypothetical protein
LHTGLWKESQKEINQWEDLNVGESIILKCMLEKWDGVVQTGFIWLRIGTNGGPLVNKIMKLLTP